MLKHNNSCEGEIAVKSALEVAVCHCESLYEQNYIESFEFLLSSLQRRLSPRSYLAASLLHQW